jgi:hypothetical protein
MLQFLFIIAIIVIGIALLPITLAILWVVLPLGAFGHWDPNAFTSALLRAGHGTRRSIPAIRRIGESASWSLSACNPRSIEIDGISIEGRIYVEGMAYRVACYIPSHFMAGCLCSLSF